MGFVEDFKEESKTEEKEVTDSSEDESEKLVQDFCKMHTDLAIELLQNQRASISAKKDAIKVGIDKMVILNCSIYSFRFSMLRLQVR